MSDKPNPPIIISEGGEFIDDINFDGIRTVDSLDFVYKEFKVAGHTKTKALSAAIIGELSKGERIVLSMLSPLPAYIALKAVIRVNQMLAREGKRLYVLPLFINRMSGRGSDSETSAVMLLALSCVKVVDPAFGG